MKINREFSKYLLVFFLFLFYQLVIVVGNGCSIVLKVTILVVYVACLVFLGAKLSLVPKERFFSKEWLSIKTLLLITPYLLFPLYNLLICEIYSLSFFDVMFVLFACIAEELFFRGMLLNCLNEKVRCAGFLQGMMFAVFHLTNTSAYLGTSLAIYIFVVFAVGIGYYRITVKCSSLIPATFLHFITNLTACNLNCFDRTYKIVGLLLCALVYLCFNPMIEGGKK